MGIGRNGITWEGNDKISQKNTAMNLSEQLHFYFSLQSTLWTNAEYLYSHVAHFCRKKMKKTREQNGKIFPKYKKFRYQLPYFDRIDSFKVYYLCNSSETQDEILDEIYFLSN